MVAHARRDPSAAAGKGGAGRRRGGNDHLCRAIWYTSPGVVSLVSAPLPAPGPGEARVRTLFSGISRGTERLVCNGEVGETEWERMRGPHQEGAFPFPVKYGYCATGVVEFGPAELSGRTVFCLYPHQDQFNAPLASLVPVPDAVPPRRATLAATMETALNGLWDAGCGPASRIIVVGAGIVGLLVTALAARLPGAEVTTVDIDAARAPLVASLGARFALPEQAPGEADVAFHASATSDGLKCAIACVGFEGTIVELSWYGAKPVLADLGGAFHSRRLKLIASQVGHVAARRRARWSPARRLAAAMQLLAIPALDALVAEDVAFADAPRELPRILAGNARGLAPVIRYPQP
jgi:threonine dehydrogenase-like Zn-dependent dehydrogenase